MAKEPKEMTPEELRARIIRLGFDGDARTFDAFCEKLRAELPAGTGVALRGSVITAERWEDGAPFDADGHRTSDLDVTLIGSTVRDYWNEDASTFPVFTKPLGIRPCDCAGLNPLREERKRWSGGPSISGHFKHCSLCPRCTEGPALLYFIEAEEEESERQRRKRRDA